MVDIIVPVYNAFEDLQKCVSSVMRHTDLTRNRLIFVNDCSPDERIAPYLDSLAGENILVHHNEKNMGFSANVNYGIRCSQDNDVLLLNTDTVVTRGWLDKISACAARDSHIASVTPLSNRAEICSVPGYLEKNDIPEGYTVDSFAELVERCSLHLYPQISVAIGFCMYIRREAIRKVGLFDAAAFERGYGEENDFCNRAALLGFYHVMCDDTFIYHTGCASFREARNELCIQHEKILRARYPDLMHQADVYLRDNPNMQVSENIKLHLALDQGRRNILLVSHRDFRKGADDNVGGVQLHVSDLVRHLRGQFNVIVAARDGDRLAVTAYGSVHSYTMWFYIGEQTVTPMLHNPGMKKLFREIMEGFAVDLVHIQHTAGLTLAPFEAAHELNIPLVCTLHDYYYLCPTVKCMHPDGSFCGARQKGETCDACLRERKDLGFDAAIVPAYMDCWREECGTALKLCDRLFAPSRSVQEDYLHTFPALEEKLSVLPHGTDFAVRRSVPDGKGNPVNRVAFLGGLSPEKGSGMALEMIEAAPDLRWYVIGAIGDDALAASGAKNLKKTGPYTREILPELLDRYSIDLVCIPSVWAETFCYTISEAVGCGIPVLCFDLGAQGERVRDGGFGWTVPAGGGAAALLDKIREIQADPADYARAVQACLDAQNYDTAAMSARYAEIYTDLMPGKAQRKECFTALLQRQGQSAAGIGASSARVEELSAKLREIETAPSYQLMLRVRKDLPFKGTLKKIVKRFV